MKPQIERDPYLSVVAMSAEAAKEFAGKALGVGEILRVEDVGPADPKRHKKGARRFHVFTEPAEREY